MGRAGDRFPSCAKLHLCNTTERERSISNLVHQFVNKKTFRPECSSVGHCMACLNQQSYRRCHEEPAQPSIHGHHQVTSENAKGKQVWASWCFLAGEQDFLLLLSCFVLGFFGGVWLLVVWVVFFCILSYYPVVSGWHPESWELTLLNW